LGEQARVNLDAFDLHGSARADLRYALRRGQRDGLHLDVIPPDRVEPLLRVLSEISQGWLSQRNVREKGFSVARFEPRFVLEQRVALLYHNGDAVAFATVMTTSQAKEAALGLMRHLPHAPPYAMEFLFIELILKLKAQGYRTLDLGMAPLAGLDVH